MLLAELAFLYLLVLFCKSQAALRFLRTYPQPKTAVPLEQVAIFQPILSGDPTLEQTLAANIVPLHGATFYWLVDDDDLEAHIIVNNIVDALREQSPEATIIKQSFPAAPEGINPKLFKINQALSSCQQQYCVILDDDTRLPYPTLQGLIVALQDCSLATGLPQYRSNGNFPSALLAAFVNNNASMTYLSTLLFMEPITINGMCYAFQREKFAAWGGFQSVLHHLTDDLAVAGMVLAQGGTIRQIPARQIIQTHLPGMRAYFRQMHRWYVFANILFAQQPLRIKALLTVLHGIPPLLLAALFVGSLFAPSLLHSGIILCTLALRHCIIMQHNEQQKAGDLRSFLLSLLSELLQSLHYLHALLSRRIRWRSRIYTVLASDKFKSV
ncbi:MAG: glycosyltransferase [Candidatus Electrothrix aestuarii]|uniref:Glycosyltransferase n=1 Tax=Candidatus Electrothrix aestuarii TaxID=3062594 RepID=A0AAU8LYN8_9BACT|nr:glycosyltransferase [Candidatus Electrothrix aestuarii]